MTRRGRKHKRGERGSVEEGQSDPKRTNMAAVEGVTFVTEPPTTEDNHKEPSLTDLREMLVDIQITVNNILLENKKISEELSQIEKFFRRSSLHEIMKYRIRWEKNWRYGQFKVTVYLQIDNFLQIWILGRSVIFKTVINASAAVTLLEQGPEKNSDSERESNPRPPRCQCSALPTELSKPHESGRMRVSPLNVDVILGPSIVGWN